MQSAIDFVIGLFRFAIFTAIVMGIVVAWGYNGLRRLAENVKEAWSNIQVVARKQISMVNQLIDVARRYDESEKFTVLKISEDLSVSAVQRVIQQSGTVLTAARLMNERRGHFLAGAALARHEDGAVAVPDDAQELEHRAHPCAASDDNRVHGRETGSGRGHGHPQRSRRVSNSGISSRSAVSTPRYSVM